MDIELTNCFYCGKFKVGLDGDASAAKKAKTVDLVPCSRCKHWMEEGVILITIDQARSKPGWDKTGKFPDPYRTGGFFVMRDEWVLRNLADDVADVALRNRWMYIEDEAARKLGLFDFSEGGDDGERQENERPADA